MTFEEFWNSELAGCYGPFENPIGPYFSLARLAWVKSGEAHAENKACETVLETITNTLDTAIGNFVPF